MRYHAPISRRLDTLLTKTYNIPSPRSKSWPPSWEPTSSSRNSSPPLRIRRLVIVRAGIRPFRIRLPLRIPPHPIARTRSTSLPEIARRLILPRSEIVLRAHARAGIGPRRVLHQHLILQSVLRIKLSVVCVCKVLRPSTPLPLLRTVAHERALVATRGDEDVWAFASESVLEPTPATSTLAVAWASPVVVWAEFGGHASPALVPASVDGVEFDERLFARETTAWAIVVDFSQAFGAQKVSLLDVLGEWWVHGSRHCWMGRKSKLTDGLTFTVTSLRYINLVIQTVALVGSHGQYSHVCSFPLLQI